MTGGQTGSEKLQQKLTLDTLLALALLPVLLLELSDQTLVHIPGHVRTRSLLLFLCRSRGEEEKPFTVIASNKSHKTRSAWCEKCEK